MKRVPAWIIGPLVIALVSGGIYVAVKAAYGGYADIARSLRYNAELQGEFQRTLPFQLRALHDFRTIFGALRNSGVDLNFLADAINQGVPVYASSRAQAELHKALVAITPFAGNLG